MTIEQELDWHDRAACTAPDVDPELFFDADRAEEAIAICGSCPVIVMCRAEADLLEGQRGLPFLSGVWAGETVTQRWRRRRSILEATRGPGEITGVS
jgi:hypothetical protein